MAGVKHTQGICATHGSVLAIKNTHLLRNTIGLGVSLGLSAKVERYRCPECGAPADISPRSVRRWNRQQKKQRQVVQS